jgi:hypothetical protein
MSEIIEELEKALEARETVLEHQILHLARGVNLKKVYSIKYIRGLIAGYEEIINISYDDMENL